MDTAPLSMLRLTGCRCFRPTQQQKSGNEKQTLAPGNHATNFARSMTTGPLWNHQDMTNQERKLLYSYHIDFQILPRPTSLPHSSEQHAMAMLSFDFDLLEPWHNNKASRLIPWHIGLPLLSRHLGIVIRQIFACLRFTAVVAINTQQQKCW